MTRLKPRDIEFADKTVIVTGAGSIGDGWGNGRATAFAYAERGAQLVLVDRDKDALENTASLVEQTGANQISVVADVATQKGVDTFVAAAVAAFGGVDVLQANVGIGMPGNLLTMDVSKWDLMYRVNVTSLFLAARAVVPHMQRRGGGAIVNVSSIASMRSTDHVFGAYASSKAAANQLVRSMAVEFAADNIRTNTVVVGYVDTPTVAVAYRDLDEARRSELAARRIESVPLKRMGTAWDIAHASVFLASDAAQFVNGTEIVVDGGMTNVSR